MSDLGSHWNDLPFWALKLIPADHRSQRPAAPSGDRPRLDAGDLRIWTRGDMPPVQLTWYQGRQTGDLARGRNSQVGQRHLVHRRKGMLLSDYGKHVLLPEDDFKDYQPPAPFVPDSPGSKLTGCMACRSGRPPPALQLLRPAHRGQSPGQRGLSRRAKKNWDAANMKATNCPEADHFSAPPAAPGWSLG